MYIVKPWKDVTEVDIDERGTTIYFIGVLGFFLSYWLVYSEEKKTFEKKIVDEATWLFQKHIGRGLCESMIIARNEQLSMKP